MTRRKRSTESKWDPTVIAYLPRTVRTFMLSVLSPATRYTFIITAGDTAGNWGNNQTLTVSTLVPPIPNT